MNRRNLRLAILRNLGLLVVNGTITAGTTAHITSTELLGMTEGELKGKLLAVPTNQVASTPDERKITAFDPVSYKLTPHRAFTSGWTGEFEVSSIIPKSRVDDVISMCVQDVRDFFMSRVVSNILTIGRMPIGIADTTVTTTQTSYTSVASLVVQKTGDVYVHFDLKSSASTKIAYGKIYLNAVATGTERTTQLTDWQPIQEEKITVVAGDTLAIYAKVTSGGTTSVRNFRVSEADADRIDYPIPSGFNFIDRVVVEYPRGVYELEVNKYTPVKVSGNDYIRILDPWVLDYPGYRLEIEGVAYPTAPSDDDDTVSGIPDNYIISYCSWYLATMYPLAQEDPSGWAQKLALWKASAKELLLANRQAWPVNLQKLPV